MKKIALVFILAVLAPSLVLALLAARSLRDQQFVLERQQALLYQSTAESIASQLRETMNREKEAFTRRVDELLQDAAPRSVALDFDTRLRAVWPLAKVGFAVTMDGIVLAPSLLDGEAATRFRRENDSFLSNRETAEVYSSPQNQLAYNNANVNIAQQAPMEELLEDQKLKAMAPNAPATDSLAKDQRAVDEKKAAGQSKDGAMKQGEARGASIASTDTTSTASLPESQSKKPTSSSGGGEGAGRLEEAPKANADVATGAAAAPAAPPALAAGGAGVTSGKADAEASRPADKPVVASIPNSAPTKPATRAAAPAAFAQKGSAVSSPGKPGAAATTTAPAASRNSGAEAGKSSAATLMGGVAAEKPTPARAPIPASASTPPTESNLRAMPSTADAMLAQQEVVSSEQDADKAKTLLGAKARTKNLKEAPPNSPAPQAAPVAPQVMKPSQEGQAQRADDALPAPASTPVVRDEIRDRQVLMANETKRREAPGESEAAPVSAPASIAPPAAAMQPPGAIPPNAPPTPNALYKEEAPKSKSSADNTIPAQNAIPSQNGNFYNNSGLNRSQRAPFATKTMQRKLEPQKQFADNEATVSRVAPAEAEFRQLIGGEASGALARFLQNKLTLMVWYRSPRDPQLVFGAQLALEKIVAALRESMVVDAQVATQICVAVIDDNGKPVFRTHPDFITNWKRPFVATEIGDVLPHWEVAVYLLDPDELNRTAATLHWTLGGMICVMLLAISAGGWLIIADLKRQLILARQKTDFVSNVSHELKTPLTSIRMFSEMLLENRSVDAARRQTYAQIISAEAARLTRLINNVLDFARIERGEKSYQMRRCDLTKVTDETLGHYLPHLEANGFQLTTAIPDHEVAIEADCDAIAQVILNLLSNAEKYGGEKKSIELELRAPESAEAKSQQAEIIVRDRGLGVPAGCERAIFEQFFRAHDALSSGIQGSGLGLTLSRQIARAHGGDIVYARREGGGSCFTLRLPIAAPEKANDPAGPAATPSNVSAKAKS